MKRGKYRHAIFAVVYSKTGNRVEYLILKRKHHWKGWEFVKGKIERFETMKMAVKRETKEETGLKILKIKNFNVNGKYKYKKRLKDRPGITGQTYHLFAVEVRKGKVKIDKGEHSGYEWLAFNHAVKKLTWPNQRKCLKVVNNIISK